MGQKGWKLNNEFEVNVARDYIDFSITQIVNFLEKLYQQSFSN